MDTGIFSANDILQEFRYLLELSVGPCGKEVLLKSNTGTLLLTSNGCSILQHLSMSHPIGTIIKNSAEKFVLNYGDSAKSFIILLAHLIKSFCGLLNQNFFKKREVLSEISQCLLQMRNRFSFEMMCNFSFHGGLLMVTAGDDVLLNFLSGIFESFIAGKFNRETRECLFKICQNIFKVFEFTRTGLTFLLDNFDSICIPVCGISFIQSQCVEGMVVQRESVPKQVNLNKCLFILISGELERAKLDNLETHLSEKYTVEMREIEKNSFFENVIFILKHFNIQVVFFEDGLPKSLQMLIELSGIVYVSHTQPCDLKRLSKMYKISVLSGLYDVFNIDNATSIIGKADFFRSCVLGRYCCSHLGPSADGDKYVQVLLCSLSEGVCYEYAYVLKNFIRSLISMFHSDEKCYLVPACGSFELKLAKHLLKLHNEFNVEYIKIVAESLIEIPNILISNSGHLVSKSFFLNSETIPNLDEKHSAVDGLTGKLVASNSIHLYESFRSKCSLFSSILELCAQIVRIEKVVSINKNNVSNFTDSDSE